MCWGGFFLLLCLCTYFKFILTEKIRNKWCLFDAFVYSCCTFYSYSIKFRTMRMNRNRKKSLFPWKVIQTWIKKVFFLWSFMILVKIVDLSRLKWKSMMNMRIKWDGLKSFEEIYAKIANKTGWKFVELLWNCVKFLRILWLNVFMAEHPWKFWNL